MMEIVKKYSLEKGISKKDALQTFIQVIVLKNIKTSSASLIGGAALTLGHSNPRFSEDIDLTGIKEPLSLRKYLDSASRELSGWLTGEVSLLAPRRGSATWRIRCVPKKGEKVLLHVDSQPYRSQSTEPLVIVFPTVPPFVFKSQTLCEIMADKLLALVMRNYVGGRDIFDIWYHWVKSKDRDAMSRDVILYLPKKFQERGLNSIDPFTLARKRLSTGIGERMKYEWGRYLPAEFKKSSLYKEIFSQVYDFLSRGGA